MPAPWSLSAEDGPVVRKPMKTYGSGKKPAGEVRIAVVKTFEGDVEDDDEDGDSGRPAVTTTAAVTAVAMTVAASSDGVTGDDGTAPTPLFIAEPSPLVGDAAAAAVTAQSSAASPASAGQAAHAEQNAGGSSSGSKPLTVKAPSSSLSDLDNDGPSGNEGGDHDDSDSNDGGDGLADGGDSGSDGDQEDGDDGDADADEAAAVAEKAKSKKSKNSSYRAMIEAELRNAGKKVLCVYSRCRFPLQHRPTPARRPLCMGRVDACFWWLVGAALRLGDVTA